MKGEEEEEGKEMTWGEKKRKCWLRERGDQWIEEEEREGERSYVAECMWTPERRANMWSPDFTADAVLGRLTSRIFRRFAPIQPVFVLQRMQKVFCWWRRVVSGTGEIINYSPGRLVWFNKCISFVAGRWNQTMISDPRVLNVNVFWFLDCEMDVGTVLETILIKKMIQNGNKV